MPVYNALPYLKEALDSLLRQTLSDVEIIALDDASTDGSSDYLAGVRDSRVRVFHMPKQGHASLLNFGLTQARAAYVARMDADDVSQPDRLAKQVAFLDDDPDVVLCGCQVMVIDECGRLGHTLQYELDDLGIRYRLLSCSPFAHPGVLFRRDAVIGVGGYDAKMVPSEDYELWWRLAKSGRFANHPEVLLHYRVHSASVTATRREKQQRLTQSISIANMLKSRIAASHGEAEAFHRFLKPWQEGGKGTADGRAFVRVVNRFLMAGRGRGARRVEEEATVRRALRWRLLELSNQRGLMSFERYEWLRLASVIDPVGMDPFRVMGRFARRFWQRAWGRAANGVAAQV
jgi:glycosyltransferase involved in cell wall biosynthesis